MVYPQLFLNEDDQQSALRRAQQDQAMQSASGQFSSSYAPQQQQYRGYNHSAATTSNVANATALLQQQIQQLQSLQQQQQHQQQQQNNYFDVQRAEDILAAAAVGMSSNAIGMNNHHHHHLQSQMLGGGTTASSSQQGLHFSTLMEQQMQQLQQQQQQMQMQQVMSTMMNSPSMTGFTSNDLQRAMAMSSSMNSQLLQSRLAAAAAASHHQTGLLNQGHQGAFDPYLAKNLQTGSIHELLNQQPQVDHSLDFSTHQQRLKRRRSSASTSGTMSPLHKRSFVPGGNNNGLAMPFEMKLSGDMAAMEDVAQNQRHFKDLEFMSKKSQRRSKSFPVKLMATLVENPNEHAVAWLPDGKSFVVVDPDSFVEAVLKKTFKQSKYASFVRKLHRWGFVRLTSGTGTDCFHHPLFQKNRMDMVQKITCRPRAETASGKGSDNKQQAMMHQQHQLEEGPPSLQGVEKFFRGRDDVAPTHSMLTIPGEIKDETQLEG